MDKKMIGGLVYFGVLICLVGTTIVCGFWFKDYFSLPFILTIFWFFLGALGAAMDGDDDRH